MKTDTISAPDIRRRRTCPKQNCGLLLSALALLCFATGTPTLLARAGSDWERLTPEKLKAPIIVELTRNPCQPAVPESTQALQASRTKDDVTTAVQAALSSRIRSVVRGAVQPVVLIDTRLIRAGDEIVLDENSKTGGRSTWKLRLKEVLSDRLVWMVETNAGGTKEIITWLDQFLRGT